MESLNIKERKLLELQITQTRNPLRISDGIMFKSNTRINEKSLLNAHKIGGVHLPICEQTLCKVGIKRNENFWSYRQNKTRHPITVADRQTDGQREVQSRRFRKSDAGKIKRTPGLPHSMHI